MSEEAPKGITITSDGRAFVYGVFGSDGCECENLEAVFGTQDEAEHYVAELRAGPMWTSQIKHNHPSDKYQYAAGAEFYGRADLLEVRPLEIGKPTRAEV